MALKGLKYKSDERNRVSVGKHGYTKILIHLPSLPAASLPDPSNHPTLKLHSNKRNLSYFYHCDYQQLLEIKTTMSFEHRPTLFYVILKYKKEKNIRKINFGNGFI